MSKIKSSPFTRRRVTAALLILLALCALGAGGYVTWLRTPPTMPDSLDEAMVVLNSPRFKRLGEGQQQRYYDRIFEVTESMDPDARREAMRGLMRDDQNREAARSLFEQQMLSRAKTYAMADETERVRILDQVIAMQQSF